MTKDTTLLKAWILQERGKLQRKPLGRTDFPAKRTYIHFDRRRKKPRISYFKKLFFTPGQMSSYPFWPFLRNILQTTKIKNVNKEDREKGIKRRKVRKPRSVYYASHRDALVYSWYAFLLNEKYYNNFLEKLGINKCVLAYRKLPREDNPLKNKCNIHFAKEVFDFIKIIIKNALLLFQI